jgi:multisubunit Na+/H+ antiporter MnhF subunit
MEDDKITIIVAVAIFSGLLSFVGIVSFATFLGERKAREIKKKRQTINL